MHQFDLGVEHSLAHFINQHHSTDTFGTIRDSIFSRTAPLGVSLDVESEAGSQFALGVGDLLHDPLEVRRALVSGTGQPFGIEHLGVLAGPHLTDLRNIRGRIRILVFILARILLRLSRIAGSLICAQIAEIVHGHAIYLSRVFIKQQVLHKCIGLEILGNVQVSFLLHFNAR